MDSNKNTASSKKNYGLIILLAVAAIIFAVLSTQSKVRELFNSEKIQTREILAKIFTEFSNQKFVIFKIKTESGIDIEIFEKDIQNNPHLKQKFSLTDDSEAFLMINGNSVNLGLNDVDHDGIVEIIAPTVDHAGNSRLNIFKYNAELSQFVPVQSQE
jgi:hypothetical protein